MKYIATVDGREFAVEILDDKRIMIDGVTHDIDFELVSDQPVFSLLIDGKSFEGLILSTDDGWQVLLDGNMYTIQVEDERERRLREAGGAGQVLETEYHLKAPMPGLVITIPVEEGKEVIQGDVLVILESMKMQNELKSPRDGVVSRIRVSPGDSVDPKQVILTVS